MTCNVGSADKTLRLIAAVVIFTFGVHHHSFWGLLGLIPLGTGILNLCPLYTLLGINTQKPKS